MAKKDEELLGKREFDRGYCEESCPFLSSNYCDLYNTGLNFDYPRCKKCISNIVPNPDAEILKLLRRICDKLGA